MGTWLAVIALVGAAGCSSKPDHAAGGRGSGTGSGSAVASGAQTYRDAVGILCGEGVPPPAFAGVDPVEREGELGRWLDQRITNREARAFVSALADVRDRAAQIRRAAATAGIEACRPLEMFAVRTVGGATVPDVTTVLATNELAQDLPVIVITPSAIVVEGTAVAEVTAGTLDPAKLPAVSAAIAAAIDDQRGSPIVDVVVAADRSLTNSLLARVLAAAHDAGVGRVSLAVGITGHEVRSVPLLFPDHPAGKIRPPALEMVAIADDDEVVVFSRSGLEGTRREPRARTPSTPSAAMTAAVQTTLREIVERRWQQDRMGADVRIVVSGSASTTVQTMADLISAVRVAPDGTPLFPQVLIAPAEGASKID
jgi:hypothetical protein